MVVVGAVLIPEAIETAELVVGVAILSGCRCGRVDNTRASLRSDCELHALHCTGRLPTTHAPTLL